MDELVDASAMGDVARIRLILDAAIHGDDAEHRAIAEALTAACSRGYARAARELLLGRSRDDMHALLSMAGYRGFRNACRRGYVDVVNFLLTSVESPGAMVSSERFVALTDAKRHGHERVVELLLDVVGDKDAALKMISNEMHRYDNVKNDAFLQTLTSEQAPAHPAPPSPTARQPIADTDPTTHTMSSDHVSCDIVPCEIAPPSPVRRKRRSVAFVEGRGRTERSH